MAFISSTVAAGDTILDSQYNNLRSDVVDQIEKIRKAADESVVNSVTLQNDDHFSFTVAANEVWAVYMVLRVVAAAPAGGLRINWDLPSGATLLLSSIGVDPATSPGAIAVGSVKTTANMIVFAGTGVELVYVSCTLIISSTAGTAQFQWAEESATSGATTIYANSSMIAHRIA